MNERFKRIVKLRQKWIILAYGMNKSLKKGIRRKEIRSEIFMKVFGQFIEK